MSPARYYIVDRIVSEAFQNEWHFRVRVYAGERLIISSTHPDAPSRDQQCSYWEYRGYERRHIVGAIEES